MAKISIKDTILVRHDVGAALVALKEYVQKNGMQEFYGELEAIEADFNLMCDYLLRGFKDPQSDAVYAVLLERTYRLYNNVKMASIVKKRSSFANTKRCAADFDGRVDAIRASLENFVQERALGSLLSVGAGSDKEEICCKHQRYMNQLFCYIISSEQWGEGVSGGMTELLVSPTVEQNDVLLVLSAIMLSLANVFDVEKWQTLVGVYEQAASVRVRQRALVGWVFGLPHDDVSFIYPVVKTKMERLLSGENTRHELLELQMQIFLCANAEADNEHIRKDIMPTLMKSSGAGTSTPKFFEHDDDSALDFHAEEGREDKMEEVEKTMSQMMDMQKAGIDVYYGGFSQMKRFHFFYQLSNWFCPYTPEHPELKDVFRKMGDEKFLDNVLNNGPFCDSDKYSFVLGIASVIDRLPQNIREAIGRNDVLGPTVPAGQCEEAAFVRRSYLQDLYRFFRLSQYKADFANPFELTATDGGTVPAFFFANRYVADAVMNHERKELMVFLHKRHLFSFVIDAGRLITSADLDTLHLMASAFYHVADMKNAEMLFDTILSQAPDDTFALKYKARICFVKHDYAQAEAYYKQLVALADNRHNNLWLATSQIYCGKTAEGMSVLFRLNYENADNVDIMRVLAWGYLMSGKAVEAEKIYERLSVDNKLLDSDMLNYAYAKWGMRKISEAVVLFKRYLGKVEGKGDTTHQMLSANFEEDKTLLDANSFSASERNIMLYLVGKNN